MSKELLARKVVIRGIPDNVIFFLDLQSLMVRFPDRATRKELGLVSNRSGNSKAGGQTVAPHKQGGEPLGAVERICAAMFITL